MVRKITLWVMLLAIVGGIVYGWMNYVVVGLWDRDSNKVTHMYVVPKPEWGTDVYYEHIDRKRFDLELAALEKKNQPVPWHMDYDYVVNQAVYDLVLDVRMKSSVD
ncbi:MAG: hypothetical protein KKB20_15400 [Proteobacteria bacterium]|nr:hypothetical protein [Pseudomonadota bacterium]